MKLHKENKVVFKKLNRNKMKTYTFKVTSEIAVTAENEDVAKNLVSLKLAAEGHLLNQKIELRGEQPSVTWKRITNDINGNPRYVCHFLAFISDKDRTSKLGLQGAYALAISRANKLGGKKYNTKSYGGGIVFKSHNIEETERRIREMMQNI